MRQRFLAGTTDSAAGITRDVLDELVAVLGRDTHQIGDHQQGERPGETFDELALVALEVGVEHLVGELPHRVLVLLEALGGDQAHQQRAVIGVGGRIQGGQLIRNPDFILHRHVHGHPMGDHEHHHH